MIRKHAFEGSMSIIENIIGSKAQPNDVAVQYDMVLHIGSPKTGSSAIQYFLLKNKRALSRQGFYYPKHDTDARFVSGGHVDIGNALIQNDVKRQCPTEPRRETGAESTLLFDHEIDGSAEEESKKNT